MKRFALGTSSFLGVLATLATISMMVFITIDVIVRTSSGASVPGVLELSETVLVAAVFLGMAYTGATNGHIAVDLVTDRINPKISRWAVAFGWTLTCVILVWMIYATGMRAIDSLASNETRMGLVNWPLWPARWFITIGLTAMLFIAITNVIRVVRGNEVLGYQEFEVIVTDTTTLQVAVEEREDIASFTAANEPVIGDADLRGPATPADGDKGRHNG
ncbi:MAG: TRAP transporter small permease [Leucobacter sp.]|jgi:TRAP-type C4-dicarboxylate transport system permease small subunit|nr:TRAP transporter small permease [Leucobacter sp.]